MGIRSGKQITRKPYCTETSSPQTSLAVWPTGECPWLTLPAAPSAGSVSL